MNTDRPFIDKSSRDLLKLLLELRGRILVHGDKCSDEIFKKHDSIYRELEFRLDKLDFLEKGE